MGNGAYTTGPSAFVVDDDHTARRRREGSL